MKRLREKLDLKGLALSAATIPALLLVLLPVDALVGWMRGEDLRAPARQIRLREYPPGSSRLFAMRAEMKVFVDSLETLPARVRSDEDGFIVPSRIHPEPETRLLFLGGSTTECLYVEEKNRFPYLVGRLLEEESGKKINAYNAAYSASHSLHSLNIFLNKGVGLRPDFAVMMHNINDLGFLQFWGGYHKGDPRATSSAALTVEADGLFRRAYLAVRTRWLPHLLAWVRDWRLLDEFLFARKLARDARRTSAARGLSEADSLIEFRRHLNLFVDIARRHDIEPVLMTQASRFANAEDPVISAMLKQGAKNIGLSPESFVARHRAFNEAIRAVGRERGAFVVDLAREVPADKKYLMDSVHYNDTGSRFVAEIIARKLLPTLKKRVSERSAVAAR